MGGLAETYPSQPLGELASFTNGTSYDKALIRDEGTPIIRISNMTDPSAPYLRTQESFDTRFQVDEGDLLVSWSASFKTLLWPGPPGILNQHIFKVEEKAGHHRGFIRHAIEAAFDDMQRKVVGIGMMHLRRGDFLGHLVPAPDLETQVAVSNFLDWLGSPKNEPEPDVPYQLQGQRRIVARVEELAAKIEDARALRQQALEELGRVGSSLLQACEDAIPTPMGEFVQMRSPDTTVDASQSYAFAGVYCFGRGVFRGLVKRGTEFAYDRLTRICTGEFVYPKLMAWEGALGVVPPECDGLYVSPEFPVFELDQTRVLPETLDVYFRTPSVWPKLAEISSGTNVRRRRLQPSAFLRYEMPLPPMGVQLQLRAMMQKLEVVQRCQAETASELDALLPAVLDRAFRGEL